MAELRVLIDANVILDVLLDRKPHAESAVKVLEHCRQNRDNAFIAAHHVTTIFYLYARDRNVETARVALLDLGSLLRVAAVDQVVIDGALALPYSDFEDAVTMMAAVAAGVDYVITRNPTDFKYGPLPVLSAAELLQRLEL